MPRIHFKEGDREIVYGVFGSLFSLMSLSTFVTTHAPDVADEAFAMGIGKKKAVSDVVEEANRQGVLEHLIHHAAKKFTYRPDIRALQLHLSQRQGWQGDAGHHGLNGEVIPEFELALGAGDPFVPARQLAQWIVQIERRVCYIQCAGQGGTGFLVAPELVLTNYHVVEKLLTDDASVRVLFDYHHGVDRHTAQGWLELDPNWTIPHSRYSTKDFTPPFGVPEDHELDYAVLKLNVAKGNEQLPGGAGIRGWVDLSGEVAEAKREATILVTGHPKHRPLQVSFRARGFELVNENHTRIVYAVDTLPGSSGSPVSFYDVFDGEFRPVAMHHNRGDKYDGDEHEGPETWSKNNRGIPLRTIKAHLDEEVRNQLVAMPG